MAKSSKGWFWGKFFIVLILLIIGLIIGMTSVGWEVKKVYHTVRFRNVPIAKGFLPNPFGLKIVYVQDAEGLKTYLINDSKDEMLPVFEIEGTTQVGDAEHRIKGIGEETRSKVLKILEDAKKGSSTTLDKAKQLLEGLGK
jgi:hypothetical protein